MDYRGALAYLDEHTNLEGNRGDRFSPKLPTAGQVGGLSLEPMFELMAALGDPHKAYRSIHITGTNGKGSTARCIDAILRKMDLSVGLYTSPNLDKVNERLVWDGIDIGDDDFTHVMELLASVEPMLSKKPSRFELLTAAAFVWFAEQAVDVAIVEVGLLGRFDATNVLESDVAVITNVGKDHTDGAPGWQMTVAEEKAGIIKPSSHVVLGFGLEKWRDAFDREVAALDLADSETDSPTIWQGGEDFELDANVVAVGGRAIDLRTPGTTYEQLFLPLHGAHQGQNMATGIVAVEAFFQRPTPSELVTEALADIQMPGRFELVAREPNVILDGAHNPHGAAAAYATLVEEFARLGSWILVVGLLSGKDPSEMLEALGAADFDAVICTEPNWSRAIPADEIATAARAMNISAEVVRNPVEALERAYAVSAADDLILVGGSLYVVGQIRSALLA